MMKSGEYAEVVTKSGERYCGVVIDSANKDFFSIKLDSGYNLNLERGKIGKIGKIKKKAVKKQVKKTEKVEFDSSLKTIAILHTGGTIASKVSYETGAVYPSFSPDELGMMFPELKGIANIKSRLIENMLSEDMRFFHYNKIAKEIEREIRNRVDGIIVTHGTDTLCYTAAALSFMLDGLSIPVILVGSQRSSDRPSSDAAINLLCAVNFIVKGSFSRVAICMHSETDDDFCEILPGCKTKKLHSSRRDAFKVVNGNPIARVGKDGNVELLRTFVKPDEKPLKIRLFKEGIKVGVLRAHPNLGPDEVRMFSKFDGLIIEGTGLGHIGINQIDNATRENLNVFEELKKLVKKIPIVMTTQCIFGRVNLNVYETGRKLADIGVLGNNSDMTFEAAFIKLSWLLSNYKKRSDIEQLFEKDMHGEISRRVLFERKFI